MKKLLAATLAAVMLLGAAACSGGGVKSADPARLNIVCTIFPQYDWVRNILGDSAAADVMLLLDNGIDMHSFQPTAKDIAEIKTCDLFIYVGGESDSWADELMQAEGSGAAMSLMTLLGADAHQEEMTAGMQQEEQGEDASEHGAPENDEHIWLSLRNAEVFCRAIAQRFCELDPAGAEQYSANAEAYLAELSALDGEYDDMAACARRDTLLFGDRFPFRYLTEDYGLEYYAAFPGCSAETEASFQTVVFLAGKADELGIEDILVIDNSDRALAETIAANTASGTRGILALDSMQSVTAEDISAGTTYLSIMRGNLDVLRQALN